MDKNSKSTFRMGLPGHYAFAVPLSIGFPPAGENPVRVPEMQLQSNNE
jgi:hypothetical protein